MFFFSRLSKLFPDPQISICIGFGVVGFVVSVILLTSWNSRVVNGKRYTGYGEVQISNRRELVDTLISRRIKNLNASLLCYQDQVRSLADSFPEKDEAKKQIGMVLVAIKNSQKELDSVQNAVIDTNINSDAKYIYPDKQAFLDAVNAEWKTSGTQTHCVNATMIDTSRLIHRQVLPDQRIKYAVQLKLKQNKRTTIMGFVRDYPLFGLWLVLSIAQMMMWFMIFPLLAGNLSNLKNKWGTVFDDVSLKDALIKSIFPFLVIGIFCFFFYIRLADGDVINDGYFLTHYNAILLPYGFFGYLAAIFCFGVYLSLADQVNSLNEKAENKIRVENTDLNNQFLDLRSAFDNAFLASALILSFYVLWAGVAINAVNGTEAIKFYGAMTGKPLIPSDLVYLMGIMHTCILLIFFLPVKLKFTSLKITQDPTATDENGKPIKTVFKTVSESLSTILVTASPLLASLVQKLIEALSGG